MAVHELYQWCICKMSDLIRQKSHSLIYNSVCQVGQSKPDGSSATKTHYLEFIMKHLRLLAEFPGLGCRCLLDALHCILFAFHTDLSFYPNNNFSYYKRQCGYFLSHITAAVYCLL